MWEENKTPSYHRNENIEAPKMVSMKKLTEKVAKAKIFYVIYYSYLEVTCKNYFFGDHWCGQFAYYELFFFFRNPGMLNRRVMYNNEP